MTAITVKTLKEALENYSPEEVSKEFGIPLESLYEIKAKIEANQLPPESLVGW